MKKNYFPIFALAISVGGFALFYLIPFVVSGFYAFVDNPVRKKCVGLKNFIDIFHNEFFLRGLSNMLLFMVIAIPFSMISALVLALIIKQLPQTGNILSVFFLVPLVLPSASAAQFWMKMFSDEAALWVVVVIYVWKNLGYNAVLFLAGLHAIPKEYYQCASVFGANTWQRFRQITLIYLMPYFFLVFIMSFVNSFKIFREVYLIWHDYPPESVYLLQHFVNNTLISMHYEKLVTAVYVLTSGIVLIVAFFFRREQKMAERLHE